MTSLAVAIQIKQTGYLGIFHTASSALISLFRKMNHDMKFLWNETYQEGVKVNVHKTVDYI